MSSSEDRMPPIAPENYDAAQKAAADAFQAARGYPVFGPFSVLIRSPELMTANRMMGDYLRLKPSIGAQLSEFVIIISAREWTQDYEWYVHAPIAVRNGVSQAIVDAIRDGQRPSSMSDDQEICYDFATELHRTKKCLGRNICADKGSLRRNRRARYRGHLRLLHKSRDDHEYNALSDPRRWQTFAAPLITGS